ncbi:hypothetical protein RCK36_22360, partial [Salmonella enterica subsp. enterica serovar 1,4,[5],12:i:-]
KACVLPENPASYRVVCTKSYLFNKAFSIISQLLVFCPALSPYPIWINIDVTRGDLTPSSSVIVAPGLLPDMFPCRHGRRAED